MTTEIDYAELLRHIDAKIERDVRDSPPRPLPEGGYITRFHALCALVGVVITVGGAIITLNISISTLQYQASLGISDRTAIHGLIDSTRLDQTGLAKEYAAGNSMILTRLTRIETLMQGQYPAGRR